MQGLQRFLAAVATGNDEASEAAVAKLSADAEPMLLSLLDDSSPAHADPEQRWWVIRALGACGTVQSLPVLAAELKQADEALRAVAAMAVGAVIQRAPAADELQPHVKKLTELLADSRGLVRQVAADALAQCGNIAIPALVDLLRFAKEQSVRSRAAYALAKIGTMEAAAPLYHCLNDQNFLVHTYAQEALEKLGLLDNLLLMP